MGRKRGKNAWIVAVLIVVSLVNGVPASAASETETEYIVKYKESAAWLTEDDGVPFDVVSESEMNRLRNAGLLEWYEPDGVITILDETASPWYEDDKWDLALIQADAAFEQNYTGRGLRIGILDSGINPHADLTGNLLPGHNYLEDADTDNTIDAYGHGTLVAGLISGAGENGAIGVATGAEIVPLKVTDGKAVMVSTVCRAIYGGINDYNCDILNLSLGITSEFESLKEAVDYAEEQGVLIVSAVGNNGTRSLYYPAAYDSVLDTLNTLNLTNGSALTGYVSGSIVNANGTEVSSEAGTVKVVLDANSTWTLTGDSYVTAFDGDLANVNLNGFSLYVGGTAVTK